MDLQAAIKHSMQTEKNAMLFYQEGAKLMKNPDARRLFELLAREEREHAGWFFQVYKGDEVPDFDVFIDHPADSDSSWITAQEKELMSSLDERSALELAMQKELELEKELKEMVAKINDPEVKAVYEENVKGTHNHFVLIESDYARLMGESGRF